MVNNTPNQVYDKAADDWLLIALKDALKARGVSMRHLSNQLAIPYRSLQNYLSGESRIPSDVLLRICGEIGLEADYLREGSFEVSHSDLYDAVHAVFKDVLPLLELKQGNRLIVRDEPAGRAETLTVAHILTVRLNEAYARYRELSFKGKVSKPRTSTETVRRGEAGKASDV